LRFFFTITLGRADLAHQLARTQYPRKLPRVLTPDQVARLLETAPGPGLKYKAALVPILAALAHLDADQHALRIDVANPQGRGRGARFRSRSR